MLKHITRTLGVATLSVCISRAAFGVEVAVKNDCIAGTGQGNICPCFVAGEEAAAWLTAPCSGNIVEVQIFWRSLLGGQPVSVENAILIYSAGAFPTPGPVMINNTPGNPQAIIPSPPLTDGFLNQFRFLSQTVPLNVPVTQNQVFVVSLRFLNASTILRPSVVSDVHQNTPECPFPQCQAGKNGVKEVSGAWTSACALGVSGDWIIRAVIDCGVATPCPADIDDNGQVNVDDLLAVISGWGPCNNCAPDIHPPPDGNNQVNVDDLLLVISSWGPCP
jgi:hypothetical protein